MHFRRLLRSLFILSFLFLAGCRLLITVDGFGNITSISTDYDCDTANSQCPYELPAGAFNETWTATADPGYRFAGWDGWCFGSLNPSCTLFIDPSLVDLEFDWPIIARFNPEIVGTWIFDLEFPGVPYGQITATFYADGKYVLTGPCFEATALNALGSFESGTYTYDPITGDFTNTIFVSAGDGCGSRDSSGDVLVDNIAIEGDSMTFFVGGEIEATLQRLVPQEFDALTGTWYFGDPLDPVATEFVQASFIAGQIYMLAEQCPDDGGAPGQEVGIYSYTAGTGAFSTTQPPDVETNGPCGFSDPFTLMQVIDRMKPAALSSELKVWSVDGDKVKLKGVHFETAPPPG